MLLRGDGAFSLGQRISKLGLKSHHIITSAPEYILCNKRVVAGVDINLTAGSFRPLPQRWKLCVQHLPGCHVHQSPGIRHRSEGSKLCRLPINRECDSYFDIQHCHAVALPSGLELAVCLDGTSASRCHAATVLHGEGLAMAASPNLGTTFVQPQLDRTAILWSKQLSKRLATNTTLTYPLNKAADTPAEEPARKPCRNRGSTGGCRQATTRIPWGTIRPGAPRVKWLGRVGFSREIKVLQPQILDSPLDPFWLDWLRNRLDRLNRSYVPCLSLPKNHKSWQYHAAEGRSRCKLASSVTAPTRMEGGLGGGRGPSRARRSPITGPGREPARHQVRRTVRSNACHGK